MSSSTTKDYLKAVKISPEMEADCARLHYENLGRACELAAGLLADAEWNCKITTIECDYDYLTIRFDGDFELRIEIE